MAKFARISLAALAAVLTTTLADCSGGQVSSQTNDLALQAFTGQAVVNSTALPTNRERALAVETATGKPTVSFRFVPFDQVQPVQALAAEALPDRVMTNDEIMDRAEQAYPGYFSPSAGSKVGDANGRTFQYRFYAPSTYLGIVTAGPDVGHVYAIGPFNGNTLTDYGSKGYWSCVFEPVRCGPRIIAARIRLIATNAVVTANAINATGVPAKGTKLEVDYSDLINCAGLNGSRVVGEFLLTVSCSGQTLTLVPGRSGEERFPFGSTNTVTLAGIRNLDNFPSASEQVSFSTNPLASSLVFTGNFEGNFRVKDEISTVDALSGTIKRVTLGNTLFLDGHLASDRTAGVVYAAPGASQLLYRLDAETGQLINPIEIEPNNVTTAHGTTGVAASDKLACVVQGRLGAQAVYAWPNKMICWRHHTQERVFESPVNWVTDSAKIAQAMHYSRRHRKFYTVNATESAATLQVVDGYKIRDIFLPGTPGTVTEIDCETLPCRVTQTLVVGSGPQGITEDDNGVLYVTNAGDRSLSTINPVTGEVVTRPLSVLTGLQYPMRILYDTGRLLVSNYESAVVVLDPVTLAETKRTKTIDMPMGMTVVGDNEIWVALPRKNVFSSGNSVAVLDRSTLAVKRVITGVGPQPWVILAP